MSRHPSTLRRAAAVAAALAAAVWLPAAGAANADTDADADADAADTRAFLLASSCAACHGPDGQSPGAIPSLHGKTADSIAEALRAFRSGERPATVMNRLAKGYSDEEIETIAAWFAARQ